jgi:hypothetical protein
MRGHVLQELSTLCVSAVLAVTVQAQPNLPDPPSSQTAQENDHMVEGVVVSVTPNTLVIRSDDNQYHLFTYHTPSDIKVNDRVRVRGGEADVDGTRAADNVNVLHIIEGTVVSNDAGDAGRSIGRKPISSVYLQPQHRPQRVGQARCPGSRRG